MSPICLSAAALLKSLHASSITLTSQRSACVPIFYGSQHWIEAVRHYFSSQQPTFVARYMHADQTVARVLGFASMLSFLKQHYQNAEALCWPHRYIGMHGAIRRAKECGWINCTVLAAKTRMRSELFPMTLENKGMVQDTPAAQHLHF